MFVIKKKMRANFMALGPKMRYARPKRCARSGETEKYQTPYPPPWLSITKVNIIPRYYPMEIDHINEWHTDNRTANLRWLTKLHHILKSQEVVRKRGRRGPTQTRIFPKPRVIIDKIKPKILSPVLF